eukprot:gene17282-biopygen13219
MGACQGILLYVALSNEAPRTAAETRVLDLTAQEAFENNWLGLGTPGAASEGGEEWNWGCYGKKRAGSGHAQVTTPGQVSPRLLSPGLRAHPASASLQLRVNLQLPASRFFSFAPVQLRLRFSFGFASASGSLSFGGELKDVRFSFASASGPVQLRLREASASLQLRGFGFASASHLLQLRDFGFASASHFRLKQPHPAQAWARLGWAGWAGPGSSEFCFFQKSTFPPRKLFGPDADHHLKMDSWLWGCDMLVLRYSGLLSFGTHTASRRFSFAWLQLGTFSFGPSFGNLRLRGSFGFSFGSASASAQLRLRVSFGFGSASASHSLGFGAASASLQLRSFNFASASHRDSFGFGRLQLRFSFGSSASGILGFANPWLRVSFGHPSSEPRSSSHWIIDDFANARNPCYTKAVSRPLNLLYPTEYS